jgi:hypothetical protein
LFAIPDEVTASTSGRPSARPFRSSSRIA